MAAVSGDSSFERAAENSRRRGAEVRPRRVHLSISGEREPLGGVLTTTLHLVVRVDAVERAGNRGCGERDREHGEPDDDEPSEGPRGAGIERGPVRDERQGADSADGTDDGHPVRPHRPAAEEREDSKEELCRGEQGDGSARVAAESGRQPIGEVVTPVPGDGETTRVASRDDQGRIQEEDREQRHRCRQRACAAGHRRRRERQCGDREGHAATQRPG